jgi:hypothetical protein
MWRIYSNPDPHGGTYRKWTRKIRNALRKGHKVTGDWDAKTKRILTDKKETLLDTPFGVL